MLHRVKVPMQLSVTQGARIIPKTCLWEKLQLLVVYYTKAITAQKVAIHKNAPLALNIH